MKSIFAIIALIFAFNAHAANVKDFGALGDNISDDTAAIQSAADNACVLGESLYFPKGTYKTSIEIAINCAMEIKGASATNAIINTTNPTQNGIKINVPQAVIINDLWVNSTVTKTAGAGIAIDLNGTASNSRSRVDNVNVTNQYIGLLFNDTIGFTLNNSYITNNLFAGVVVDNNAAPDGGDSLIQGCTIDSSNPSSLYAILQRSSGGLKIIGNKILRHQYGYLMNLDNGVETSILIIDSNSFEHQKYASIRLLKQPSYTGKFLHTIISNNQINGNESNITNNANPNYGIQQSGSGWFAWLNITGNIIQVGGAGGVGIELEATNTGIISGNVLVGTSGSQRVGVSIGANSHNISVKSNSFNGMTNNIVNASPSTIVTN